MPRIKNVVEKFNDENNAVITGTISAPYSIADNLRSGNLGTSANDAAFDATDIWLEHQARGMSNPSDGNYWIRTNLGEPAYQVYCRFNRGGKHWVKVCSYSADYSNSVYNGWFGPKWAGWRVGGHTSATDMGQTSNWQGAAHVQSITPAYGNYPMGSLYCERPDSGAICFIWTMDGNNGGAQGTYQLDGTWVYPSLMSVINQPNEKAVNVGSYGNNQLQTGLWLRSDTNTGYSGGTRSGFKMPGDFGGSANYMDNMTGGSNQGGWAQSQIGCARNNTDSNHFGGGFGCRINAHGPNSYNWHGHWWGHGSGRNSSAWTGDTSGGANGHTFYVSRK